MSTCLYGASVKTGFDPTTYVPIDISVFSVVAIAVPWWWNALSFAFLPAEMQLSALAALNPDDPPSPNFLDVIAALDQKNPVATLAIDQWIKAKLTYLLFTHFCVCNGASSGCVVGAQNHHGSDSWLGTSAPTWLGAIDANTHQVTLTLSGLSNSDGTTNYYYEAYFDDGSGGSTFTTPAWTYYPFSTTTHTVVLSAGHPYRRVGFHVSSGNTGRTLSVTDIYSNVDSCFAPVATDPPAPVTYVQPPTLTPPAPQTGCTLDTVCAELFRIEQKINSALATATLLQRWELPFGYMLGAVHSGLTGSGSFAVSRVLGLLLTLTTPPPGGRVLPGNPPYVWDAGWVSINDTSGMLEEKRVTRSGYVWLPGAAALATSFNYALDPGVVLRVQELEAEA